MLEQIPWKSNKQNKSVTFILFTEQLQLQPRNSQQNHAQALLGELATCAKRETVKTKMPWSALKLWGFF